MLLDLYLEKQAVLEKRAMLLDLYLEEELEKLASGRLAAWGVQNAVKRIGAATARVAPINNMKVLGPVRKQIANGMNQAAKRSMMGSVAAHVPRVPAMNTGQLAAKTVQNPADTPFGRTSDRLKYLIADGATPRNTYTPYSMFSAAAHAAGISNTGVMPTMPINATDPMWYARGIKRWLGK
jgi:hypothetical protein